MYVRAIAIEIRVADAIVYVQVRLTGSNHGYSRLVRLYACDSAFDSLEHSIGEPAIAISPILLHNMGSPERVTYKVHNTTSATPWRTAKAVTIARIASEHSMHKRYQSLLIQALKTHFQAKKRVLQDGDVIALPLDASLAQFEDLEGEVPAEEAVEEEDFE